MRKCFISIPEKNMKNKLILTATIALLCSVAAYGQTQREQTILNVFGRLDLTVDPYGNLNFWTDGYNYYRPFFADLKTLGNKPCMNGDTIYFFGGNLHEGGWTIDVLLAADGKMTIAETDYTFKKGDKVEHRKIGNETLLVFSDVDTGIVKSILKKFDGKLEERYIDDFRQYILAGTYKRKDGSSDPIVFNRSKSVVTGFPSKGENAYTFVKEFGDVPINTLIFSEKEIYKAQKTLTGLELIPMKLHPEADDYWATENYLIEDNAKPKIVLIKTAEGQSGLPVGTFPLVSKQVMTRYELVCYAGGEIYSNSSYHKHLQIMRNEIFARYGHKFIAGGEMAKHFATQTWYKAQFDDVTAKLTEIERINIALIQILEKEK